MPAIPISTIYGAFRGYDDAVAIRGREQNQELQRTQLESAIAENKETLPLRKRALETGVQANEAAIAQMPQQRRLQDLQIDDAQERFSDYKVDRTKKEKIEFLTNQKEKTIFNALAGNWDGVAKSLSQAHPDGEDFTQELLTGPDGKRTLKLTGNKGSAFEFTDDVPFDKMGITIDGPIEKQVGRAVLYATQPEMMEKAIAAQEERDAKAKDRRGPSGKEIDDLSAFMGPDGNPMFTAEEIKKHLIAKDGGTKSLKDMTDEEVKLWATELFVKKEGVPYNQEDLQQFIEHVMSIKTGVKAKQVPLPIPRDKKGKINTKRFEHDKVYQFHDGPRRYNADTGELTREPE